MIVHLKGDFTLTNIVSAVAALSLAASPWRAGFTGEATAAGNAVLCGLLMLVSTAAALFQLQDWRSWMNLIPGIWVLLSPWILGFATHVAASAIHIVIGVVVSILAMLELYNTETFLHRGLMQCGQASS
jgi:hypothetical protein